MSIYPDRKNGKLTGRYRVEVQSGGQRIRMRASSLDEAKALELSILQGEIKPKASNPKDAPKPLTLKEAIGQSQGILWAGQETEGRSFRKLAIMSDIVGPDMALEEFDANTVDKIVRHLQDNGRSDGTINRYLSAVSAFLGFCKRRKLYKAELPELEWRDEDQGRIRWITYSEERQLMELLPAPYSTIVYIAIRTGLRAAELLSLKPDQVEPRWIHLWKTKNGLSRSVPINDELYKLLTALVYSGFPGYFQLRDQWQKARKAMGLDDDDTFVFHACRHTYATRAIQAGVNIRVLQRLMGHKTINTTLRYAHVDDKTLSDAALDALSFHEGRGSKVGELASFTPPTLN